MKKRLEWLDLCRGLCMVLVMVGHIVNGKIFRGLIYSFHMPLLFILSGITFRFSDSFGGFLRQVKKRAKRLLIPYFLLFAAWEAGMVWIYKQPAKSLSDYLKRVFLATPVDNLILQIRNIGIIWFLMTMFMMNVLADGIHLVVWKLPGKAREPVMWGCVLFTMILGVLYSFYLPFSLELSLAAMVFFYIGHTLKERPVKLWHGVLWLIGFFCILYQTQLYFDLGARKYPLFPLSHVIAVAGSWFAIWCSLRLDRLGDGLPLRGLRALGRHSLAFLGVHHLDEFWKYWWQLPAPIPLLSGWLWTSILRMLCDLIVMACYLAAVDMVRRRLQRPAINIDNHNIERNDTP